MEKSAEKMDVSRAARGPSRLVGLPERPLSFWVRLAHVHRLGAAYRTPKARLRVLSDFELILQLEGSSWIWSEHDGGSVDLLHGSIAFIPPGFVHAWGSQLGTHIAVHFDFHARPDMQVPGNMRLLTRAVERNPLPFVPLFALRTRETERPFLVPLVTPLVAPRLWQERLGILVEVWSRRAVNTLEGSIRTVEVLGFALRNLAVDPDGRDANASGGSAKDARRLELIRALDSSEGGSIAERATVAELAAYAHMSETSFRAAFVRTTGCGPRRYLEERRVEHVARALPETDRSVAEISRAVGYTDPHHFSRVFRRVTGVSPRRYRTNAHTA